MEKGRKRLHLTDISLLVFVFAKVGVFAGNGAIAGAFSAMTGHALTLQDIVEYVSLALFIALMMLRIGKRRKLCLTRQVMFYGLFTVFACLSCLWAWDRSFAAEALKNVVALLAFLAALSNYMDGKERLLQVMKYVAAANGVVALKILALYWTETGSAAVRIQAITGIHFNTVGQVMAFSILFSIYLYYECSNKSYLFIVIPEYAAILLTGSRKSILIPILGVFLILLLRRDWKKLLPGTLALAAGALLAGVGIKLAYPEMYQKMLQEFTALADYGRGIETDDWSINLRSFFVETGKEIFKAHPLFGIGINNFAYYVGNFTSYTVERYSHNNYIELLSCTGLTGFLLYYLSYAYLFVRLAARVWKEKRDMLSAIAFSVLLDLMIMEWGIVSYSGCMYHMYILFVYHTVLYQKELRPEVGEKDGG